MYAEAVRPLNPGLCSQRQLQLPTKFPLFVHGCGQQRSEGMSHPAARDIHPVIF